MPKKTIEEQQAAWAERTLDRIEGAENRATARKFITTRRAKGCKVGTIANYAHALRIFSTHLKGRAYRLATAEDVSAFIAQGRSHYTPASLKGIATLLLGLYNWLYGDDTPPRSFRAAFRVRGGKPRDILVTDEEFAKLVGACELNRDKAMFWLLRETGFRISELASLNVGSISWRPDGCDIEMPADAPRLKTGPRSVPIMGGHCTRILRALLAERPHASAKDPLFISYSDRNRGERLDAHHFNGHIRQARQRAGLQKRITAHSYRHTKATELARRNWNNELINRYMGWFPGSRMAGIYVHVTHEDLQAQVRRDAGYEDLAVSEVPFSAPRPSTRGQEDALAAALEGISELLRRSKPREAQAGGET